MVKETATTWQQRLDQDGRVVIKSRQQSAAWMVIGCVAVMVVGLALLASGGVGGIVAGLVLLGVGGLGLYRAATSIRTGKPHLVVTTEHLEYGGRSVPWSTVSEVVRHTRTVRGDTTTYVWVLSSHRERLRLPTTLVADAWELGGWLDTVRDRHCDAGR